MLWFLGVLLVLGCCFWLYLSSRLVLPVSSLSAYLCFLLALAAVFCVLVGYNLRQLQKKREPAKNKRVPFSDYLMRSKSIILLHFFFLLWFPIRVNPLFLRGILLSRLLFDLRLVSFCCSHIVISAAVLYSALSPILFVRFYTFV